VVAAKPRLEIAALEVRDLAGDRRQRLLFAKEMRRERDHRAHALGKISCIDERDRRAVGLADQHRLEFCLARTSGSVVQGFVKA
jgi:hypothetical protein